MLLCCFNKAVRKQTQVSSVARDNSQIWTWDDGNKKYRNNWKGSLSSGLRYWWLEAETKWQIKKKKKEKRNEEKLMDGEELCEIGRS